MNTKELVWSLRVEFVDMVISLELLLGMWTSLVEQQFWTNESTDVLLQLLFFFLFKTLLQPASIGVIRIRIGCGDPQIDGAMGLV